MKMRTKRWPLISRTLSIARVPRGTMTSSAIAARKISVCWTPHAAISTTRGLHRDRKGLSCSGQCDGARLRFAHLALRFGDDEHEDEGED